MDAPDVFFEKYYNLALHFLSFRPRSEKEIKEYLKAKIQKSTRSSLHSSGQEIKNEIGINESLVESIIQKLKEKRFVNDLEFAQWWIEQRIKFKPRALKLIKIELKQKGISSEIIDFAISNVSPRFAGEAGKSQMSNDKEMAKTIIEKKIGKYKNLPKQEVYQKLGRILAQKGFDWDIIRQGIDEFYKNKV